MIRIISCLALLFIFPFFGFAQQRVTPGNWTFQVCAGKVLQLRFSPADYTRNENITGAVLPGIQRTGIKKIEIHSATAKLKRRIVRLEDYKIVVTGDSICITHSGKQYELRYQAFADGNKGYRIYLADDEKIFGGGERALPLNRRGYKFPLYNNPWYGYGEGADALNYSVPFITSSRRYGLLFDNPARGYMDIAHSNSRAMDIASCSGALDLYLIPGNDFPEVLHTYHTLTGTQPLLPRWALGSFMSRFGYTSEVQTKTIFQQMKAAEVPFDAIIIDLFWFGDSIKKTLGNLDWVNKKKWPDPARMISDFKADSVETILVTEPFILEDTRSYEGFKPYLAVDSNRQPFRLTDFYFGYGGLIDMFRQDSKDHFWKYYNQQMQNGVEGWWGDLGEPEKHPTALYHNLKDYGHSRLFESNEVHNVYGHNWTRMLYEKYQQYYPGKRLFSLNRSGFAGTQRYGIVPWSGDVSRSWSGLRAQLPIMLGMSMSGVPFIHADAGGFAGGEGDWELYVRWLQFAIFTPIFRPHGGALYEVDPNSFSFPSEIALAESPYKERAIQAARLRYRMLPYNYSICYQQAANGDPLVSPLYYYSSDDTASFSAVNQFMWGKQILVAPVLQKNAESLNVYLPAGSWYRWQQEDVIAGRQNIQEKLTADLIPVFVKAGSIIPLVPASKNISNTKAYTTADLEWHYYAGKAESSFELFDDDGSDPVSLQTNKYEIILVRVKPVDDGYNFSITVSGNGYPDKPLSRKHKIYLHGTTGDWRVSGNKRALIDKDAGGIFILLNTTTGNVNFELKTK